MDTDGSGDIQRVTARQQVMHTVVLTAIIGAAVLTSALIPALAGAPEWLTVVVGSSLGMIVFAVIAFRERRKLRRAQYTH